MPRGVVVIIRAHAHGVCLIRGHALWACEALDRRACRNHIAATCGAHAFATSAAGGAGHAAAGILVGHISGLARRAAHAITDRPRETLIAPYTVPIILAAVSSLTHASCALGGLAGVRIHGTCRRPHHVSLITIKWQIGRVHGARDPAGHAAVVVK